MDGQLWDAYASTHVELIEADGSRWLLRPAAPGHAGWAAHGPQHPTEAAYGPQHPIWAAYGPQHPIWAAYGPQHPIWAAYGPPSLQGVAEAWVITAHNPFSRPLTDAENAARAVAMLAEVERAGRPWLPADGRAPDGSWSEAGLMLPGAPRDFVLDLAHRFEQNAVFRWTPESLAIVGVRQPGERVQGWTGERILP